jgi:hypothetical protein
MSNEAVVTQLGAVHRVDIVPEITGQMAPGKTLEQPQGTPAATSEIPAGIPEKFVKDGKVDYAALAASYTELEKKVGAPAPEKKADVTPPVDPKATPEVAQSVPGVTPEQMTKFSQEIVAEGKLSDTSYADLLKAGYPKAVVDAYVNGQLATAQVAQTNAEALGTRIADSVGGKDKYTEMIAWGAQNFSEAEIAGFDQVIASGNEQAITLAVEGLKSRYVAANGSQGKFTQGNVGASVGDSYKSRAEMQADMRDPRYAKDQAFRDQVALKLSRSSIM